MSREQDLKRYLFWVILITVQLDSIDAAIMYSLQPSNPSYTAMFCSFGPLEVPYICRPNDSPSPVTHQQVISVIQPIADVTVPSSSNFLALLKFVQQPEVARDCSQKCCQTLGQHTTLKKAFAAAANYLLTTRHGVTKVLASRAFRAIITGDCAHFPAVSANCSLA